MGGLNIGSTDISAEALYWNHFTHQFPTLLSVTAPVNDRHNVFDKIIESMH